MPKPVRHRRSSSSGSSTRTTKKLHIHLSQERIATLDVLVDVDPSESFRTLRKNDQSWTKNFRLLQDYFQRHATFAVPRSHPVLGPWCCHQRALYKQGALNEHRSSLLTNIGFFSPQHGYTSYQTWEQRYDALLQYKMIYGNCRVPQSYNDDGSGLGRWVVYMRHLYKTNNRHQLDNQKIDKLNALGFVWDAGQRRTVDWETRLQQLKDYIQKHGHSRVPFTYKEDTQNGENGSIEAYVSTNLGHWVQTQRINYRKNRLTPERVEKLRSIGFSFAKSRALEWEEQFQKLETFVKQHGHINVPLDQIEDVVFASWMRNLGAGNTTRKQADRLRKLGMNIPSKSSLNGHNTRKRGRGATDKIETTEIIPKSTDIPAAHAASVVLQTKGASHAMSLTPLGSPGSEEGQFLSRTMHAPPPVREALSPLRPNTLPHRGPRSHSLDKQKVYTQARRSEGNNENMGDYSKDLILGLVNQLTAQNTPQITPFHGPHQFDPNLQYNNVLLTSLSNGSSGLSFGTLPAPPASTTADLWRAAHHRTTHPQMAQPCPVQWNPEAHKHPHHGSSHSKNDIESIDKLRRETR